MYLQLCGTAQVGIRFTWNKDKAKRNQKRHGIRFEDARNVFNDPYIRIVEDCETEEGMRYHAIGYVDQKLLAVVVYLDQTEQRTIRPKRNNFITT